MSKGRKKPIWALFGAIFFVVLGVGTLGAEGKNPIPPFIHGQEAMFQGNLSEAIRWYRITHRDFSQTLEGKQSLVQEFLILTSREIGNAKLASLYREASDLQQIEGSHSKVYSELSQSFEMKSEKVLGDLVPVLEKLRSTELDGLALTVSINPEVAEAPKAISALEKGEWVDGKKREEIQNVVYLRTYLGLLGEITKSENEAPPFNIQNARLEPKSLFFALGSRLLIGGENFEDRKLFEASRVALTMVQKETASVPYDKVRVAAQEMLEKIETLQKKGIKK